MYQVVSPLGFAYPPLQCLVRRHGNEHEIARVRVSGMHNVASEQALAAGAPITVTYGADASSAYNFYGYVDHTEPHALQSGSYTDIVCVGPTRICKSGSDRSFVNHTIPGILGDVFNQRLLAFVGNASTQHWATQAQTAAQSDWAFALSLVAQIGFTLVPEGAIVRALDPVKILSTAPPLLVQQFTTFEPIVAAQGTAATSTYARHVVETDDYAIGANPPTILGTYSGIAPQVSVKVATASPPACLGEAQTLAQGAARNNVWVHRAKLIMPGDVRLKPGVAIDFEPTSKDFTPYAGLWAVLDVDHTLVGQDRFNTKVILGRDTFGPVQVRPPSSALPLSIAGGKGRALPGTVWRNSQWSAQWNVRSI